MTENPRNKLLFEFIFMNYMLYMHNYYYVYIQVLARVRILRLDIFSRLLLHFQYHYLFSQTRYILHKLI